MRTAARDIDEYIAGFPPEVQARLARIRATIRRQAPRAEEKISYQIPTFFLDGNLIHFAAFQHHIGIYPGSDAIAHFKSELAPYKTAKGSVQFPQDKPVPYGLIAKIVKYRVGRNEHGGRSARKKR